MIKQTIVALLLSVGASSVFAAGTVKVFSNGSSEAKTLTGAEHLIDLVGQPRLANSWWPGAVISEELAHPVCGSVLHGFDCRTPSLAGYSCLSVTP